MQWWYRYADNRPPPLARVSLETLTAERAELYAHIPPPGRPITIEVSPFPVDENILGEEDIAEAVLRMRLNYARGLSVIRAKHLRMWLCTETREEDLDPGNWEKVASIIHADFSGGELSESFDWQTVVMIPKGGGTDFRGIGLVEVLCKAISGIINIQISSSIQFHDSLHSFHTGIGTGTTNLKAKLLEKLIAMRETVLHPIFLDMHKAYDDLERDCCMYILTGYGV